MSHFLEIFQKELISLGVALLSSFVLWLFRGRALLCWSKTHSFSFIIHPVAPPSPSGGQAVALPAFTIQTASFWFANLGRLAATQVETTFNYRPDNFQVWPVRPYETIIGDDNRFTLRFATLAPKENFQIELLSMNMPELLNVRCSEAVGRFIAMRPTRILSSWLVFVLWSFIFLGLAASVYIVLRLGSYAFGSATP